MNGARGWKSAWMSIMLMGMIILGPSGPGGTATGATTSEFVGGLTESVLLFDQDLNNTSLSIELPRGSTIVSAEMTLQGLSTEVNNSTFWDYRNHDFGRDMWTLYMDGLDAYPPIFNPYNTGWAHPDGRALTNIKNSDDQRWWIQTPGESLPPPLEWPVKIFQYDPDAPPGSEITFSWEGYSKCFANQTNQYHAELWFWNHASSRWVKEAEYGSNNMGDVHLNHTLATGSAYVASNGSFVAAVVGVHAEGRIVMPNPISDAGHLFTDYVSLTVNASTGPLYPNNTVLEIGGTEVLNRTGVLDNTLVLGDPQGLASAIQTALDAHQVRPGNATIPITFRVGPKLGGAIRVSGLAIEHEPPVNTPPVWKGPDRAALDEDSPWTPLIDLDGAFGDDHNAGELLLEVASVSDPSNLSARVTSTHKGNWLEVLPAVDFSGEVQVTVAATDLFAARTVSPPVTVTVNGTPDAPVLEAVQPQSLEEGETLDITMAVTDPDLPDDTLTFSDTSYILEIDPVSGRILWTPGSGDVGTHQFSVTVQDGHGLNDSVLVEVEVIDVNGPPEILSPLEISTTQGEESTYQVVAYDPDLPFGEVLTLQAFADGVEVLVDQVTGQLTFTPGNDQVPGFDITLRVEDRFGLFDEALLRVEVANVNDAPTVQPMGPFETDQGQEMEVQLVYDDPDLQLDLEPPESLTVAYDGPDFLAPDSEGLIHVPAVLQAHVGTHQVTYTVTDTEGMAASVVVVFTFTDVNVGPSITSDVPYQFDMAEDEAFAYTFEAEDDDGDGLSWSDDSDLFDIDPSTGVVSFTPTQDDVGHHVVSVMADDGNGGMAQVTFEVVVVNVNDAPVIEYVTPQDGATFDEGDLVKLVATARDEDGDALEYAWYRGDELLGSAASVDLRDLRAGTHRMTLSVSDGTVDTTHELTITVEPEEPGNALLIAVVAVVVIGVLGLALLFVMGRHEGGGNAPGMLA